MLHRFGTTHICYGQTDTVFQTTGNTMLSAFSLKIKFLVLSICLDMPRHSAFGHNGCVWHFRILWKMFCTVFSFSFVPYKLRNLRCFKVEQNFWFTLYLVGFFLVIHTRWHKRISIVYQPLAPAFAWSLVTQSINQSWLCIKSAWYCQFVIDKTRFEILYTKSF